MFLSNLLKPKKSSDGKSTMVPYPVLYPMGLLTFSIACSHCKNFGSDLCHDCMCEIKSGFELKTEREVNE